MVKTQGTQQNSQMVITSLRRVGQKPRILKKNKKNRPTNISKHTHTVVHLTVQCMSFLSRTQSETLHHSHSLSWIRARDQGFW